MEMITVEEMCAVVEAYIYEKKGRHIKIELRYHPLFIQRDLDMLHHCYNIITIK